MNKPLLLSLAAAALLSTNLNAQTMFERFQAMENEMAELKKEIATLKTQKNESKEDDEKEDSEDTEETQDSEAEDEAEDDEKEEMDVEEEIADIQESISELNKATSGNHLKFGVDYRFSLENLNYKMADGSKENNDAFMTNRLWLNMDWSATKNLSFSGQLAYNKAFGQRSGASTGNAYETFDWIANENAYDDIIRVRSAYFLYRNDTFAGTDIPWTFSVGRRPSTNGHLINLRDDDKAASPMGHAINVEFDGLSAKFGLENLTGANGMYVKLCAGRGMSNAAPKFSSTPYASNDTENTGIDLAGLIFVPYDNGQYSIGTQYYYANNLIDMTMATPTDTSFTTVGGMHSITANFVINGIGNEISDFLDDTTFFVSGAMSITNPNGGKAMLGSKVDESVTGTSYWIGTQFPSLITEDGRWGLEYNHGSEHWRSITYGEDTNIGSKVATRGDAYEAYMTEYLVDDILSMQIRYTYIDYKYTGSNGFFGNTSGNSALISDLASGNPLNPMDGSHYVDTAQDIRFYLRYKY